MPTIHHVPREFHQKNAILENKRLLVFLIALLMTLVVFLVFSVLAPHDSGHQTALAAGGAVEPSASPSPSIQECLENVAWPDQFEVPFVATFQKGTRYGPWSGNVLQYQYRDAHGELKANFRSYFPRCTNLPFVPLSFFGKPCEYYFARDPSNDRWQAYVYSTTLKQYFRLSSNLGPLVPDFVARYQALRPAGCSNVPLSSVPLPVGNPRDGTPVEWFLTSGTAKSTPSPASSEGYYAAIAKPVTSGSPESKSYKPPYAFTGEPPGAGILLAHKRSVYGELVYDWKKFVIKSNFPKGTFTPPQGYTEVRGFKMPSPPPPPGEPDHPNCVACHMSDPNAPQTFYMERRRAIAAGILDKKKKD
jgi:hypothetical protein